jgi:hypothetical protein
MHTHFIENLLKREREREHKSRRKEGRKEEAYLQNSNAYKIPKDLQNKN